MNQLPLLYECVLPGCQQVTQAVGSPCTDCRAAFEGTGWQVRPRAGAREVSEEEIAREMFARDEEARATHRAQARLARAAEKKQTNCLICELPRLCTRTPIGWECATCRREQGRRPRTKENQQ